MADYITVEVRSEVDYWEGLKFRYLRLKRESRPLFRLRRWFLSLRWVNNWLWRRGNKVNPVDYDDRWCSPRQNGFTTDSTFGHWYDHGVYVYGMGGKKQNTGILPNYPSIQELSQNISEDGHDLKAVDEAKERDDFVSLEDANA